MVNPGNFLIRKLDSLRMTLEQIYYASNMGNLIAQMQKAIAEANAFIDSMEH
jgi:hypothetical protein